jgi:phenylalanyl-tRNA synthetase alpha chain
MPPSSSADAAAAATAAAPAPTAAEDREEAAILSHLSSGEGAVIDDTYPWSQSLGIDHDRVVGAVKSLLADSYVEADDVASQFWVLEDEGRQVLEHGSPEARVLDFVRSRPSGSATVAEIQSGVGPDAARIGVGNCMKNKWIQKSKDDPAVLVASAAVDSVRDQVREQLAELQDKGFAPGALDEKVRHKYETRPKRTALPVALSPCLSLSRSALSLALSLTLPSLRLSLSLFG